MAEITIRKYHRRDREAVLDITEESFGTFCLESNMEEKYGTIAGMSWQERKRDGISYDLKNNPDHTFVAVAEGEVVGYICTRVYPSHLIGHVANMAVAPARQGRGIGKMLLTKALAHFRSAGLRYARIETLEQNARANEFYPSFGFEEIGRQVFYFRELEEPLF